MLAFLTLKLFAVFYSDLPENTYFSSHQCPKYSSSSNCLDFGVTSDTLCVALQLKIRNDFDPVLSPESSLFVLKSNKHVRLFL